MITRRLSPARVGRNAATGNREEVIMVPVSAAHINYSSVSLILGAGLLTLLLLLSRYNIKEFSSRAITSLSGHLRARPDPWLECALRDAFRKFDRELAVVLRDRDLTHGQGGPPGPNSQLTRPSRPGPWCSALGR
jgi:hypothetical protein